MLYFGEFRMGYLFEMNSREDEIINNEQEHLWFLGSLIPSSPRKNNVKFNFQRQAKLHNQITYKATRYGPKLMENLRIAGCLSEFFPLKWLLEINDRFRQTNSIAFRSEEDRVGAFLAFIECYLAFRNLIISETTLNEINQRLSLTISLADIRRWKARLLRIFPELAEHWKKIRSKRHQLILISCTIKCMNKELRLNGCSKAEIFRFKQRVLELAKEFGDLSQIKHIKRPEVWARAICFQVCRELYPELLSELFPCVNSTNTNIQHKCWQLRRALNLK